MAAFYLDTSALVKAYVHEVGSAWLRALLDPAVGNQIFIMPHVTATCDSVLSESACRAARRSIERWRVLKDKRCAAHMRMMVDRVSRVLT